MQPHSCRCVAAYSSHRYASWEPTSAAISSVVLPTMYCLTNTRRFHLFFKPSMPSNRPWYVDSSFYKAHHTLATIQDMASVPSDSAGRVTNSCYQCMHSHTSNTHTESSSVCAIPCMAKSRVASANHQNHFI